MSLVSPIKQFGISFLLKKKKKASNLFFRPDDLIDDAWVIAKLLPFDRNNLFKVPKRVWFLKPARFTIYYYNFMINFCQNNLFLRLFYTFNILYAITL